MMSIDLCHHRTPPSPSPSSSSTSSSSIILPPNHLHHPHPHLHHQYQQFASMANRYNDNNNDEDDENCDHTNLAIGTTNNNNNHNHIEPISGTQQVSSEQKIATSKNAIMQKPAPPPRLSAVKIAPLPPPRTSSSLLQSEPKLNGQYNPNPQQHQHQQQQPQNRDRPNRDTIPKITGRNSQSSKIDEIDHDRSSSSTTTTTTTTQSSSGSGTPPDRVSRWQRGFEYLIRDPLGLELFEQFLDAEIGNHNLTDFYFLCESVPCEKNDADRPRLVYAIYRKHLRHESDRNQIGGVLSFLSAEVRSRLSAAYVEVLRHKKDNVRELSAEQRRERDVFGRNLFREAKDEIYRRLSGSLYSNFLRSQIYLERYTIEQYSTMPDPNPTIYSEERYAESTPSTVSPLASSLESLQIVHDHHHHHHQQQHQQQQQQSNNESYHYDHQSAYSRSDDLDPLSRYRSFNTQLPTLDEMANEHEIELNKADDENDNSTCNNNAITEDDAEDGEKRQQKEEDLDHEDQEQPESDSIEAIENMRQTICDDPNRNRANNQTWNNSAAENMTYSSAEESKKDANHNHPHPDMIIMQGQSDSSFRSNNNNRQSNSQQSLEAAGTNSINTSFSTSSATTGITTGQSSGTGSIATKSVCHQQQQQSRPLPSSIPILSASSSSASFSGNNNNNSNNNNAKNWSRSIRSPSPSGATMYGRHNSSSSSSSNNNNSSNTIDGISYEPSINQSMLKSYFLAQRKISAGQPAPNPYHVAYSTVVPNSARDSEISSSSASEYTQMAYSNRKLQSVNGKPLLPPAAPPQHQQQQQQPLYGARFATQQSQQQQQQYRQLNDAIASAFSAPPHQSTTTTGRRTNNNQNNNSNNHNHQMDVGGSIPTGPDPTAQPDMFARLLIQKLTPLSEAARHDQRFFQQIREIDSDSSSATNVPVDASQTNATAAAATSSSTSNGNSRWRDALKTGRFEFGPLERESDCQSILDKHCAQVFDGTPTNSSTPVSAAAAAAAAAVAAASGSSSGGAGAGSTISNTLGSLVQNGFNNLSKVFSSQQPQAQQINSQRQQLSATTTVPNNLVYLPATCGDNKMLNVQRAANMNIGGGNPHPHHHHHHHHNNGPMILLQQQQYNNQHPNNNNNNNQIIMQLPPPSPSASLGGGGASFAFPSPPPPPPALPVISGVITSSSSSLQIPIPVTIKFSDEECPYKLTIYGPTVTLAAFKQAIPHKRGKTFRYFFKRKCTENEQRESQTFFMQELVEANDAILPQCDGKIFATAHQL